ncbi:MAG: tRNA (adenosine(37)-N6)-dimethylallyltransferase MiaA [bacterium]|nr:tRNA (adenosine(37)-N6)-dimethylallyltransferase MiaA [bacterium]
MGRESLRKVIAIVGPTASGKSDIAVKLAKRFNGEIISADSRQVYKGMDIGTGKVPISYEPQSGESMKSRTPPFRRKGGVAMYKGIPHHMLNIVSPKKQYGVSDYQKAGQKTIYTLLANDYLPIVCGGTGQYVDSLLYERAYPDVPPNKALRRQFDKLTAEKLFKMLRKLDPRRAKTIDPWNKRRLIRALEIVHATGRPVPETSAMAYNKPRFNVLVIGVSISQAQLKKKIALRLAQRMRRGALIREVRCLHEERGVSWRRLDEFGLEYRYVSRYLRGMLSRDAMTRKLQLEIERYAKRQMTWLRRNPHIRWIKDSQQALRLTAEFLF